MSKSLKLCECGCGRSFIKVSSKKFFSKDCYDKVHTKTFTCKFCGNEFQRVAYGKTTYEICGASCRGKYARSLNNPMHEEKHRNKMIATLKRIGHKPTQQGGNGKGITEPQRILHEALGDGWSCEYAQGIKGPRNLGYPPNYKIDIANVHLKIAIEVDGLSHNTIKRKEQDRKKELKLKELGWKVIRFKNHDILSDLEGCVRNVWNLTE